MALTLDILAVAIVAITILLGYKDGLVKSLISLFGGIVAIVLAFTFSSSLGSIINDKIVQPPVNSFVYNTITTNLGVEKTILENENLPEVEVGKILDKIPSSADLILNRFDTSKEKIKADILKATGTESIKTKVENTTKTITTPITTAASKAIAFAVILIATYIAFMAIKFIFKFVDKLPIIKQFNKLGGLIIGIVNGVLIMFILTAVLSFVLPITKSNEQSVNEEEIQKTVVIKVFYNNNPIKL